MTRLESLSTRARNAKRKPGVTFEKSALNGNWVVRAMVKGRLTTIGCRDTEEQANELWDEVKPKQSETTEKP